MNEFWCSYICEGECGPVFGGVEDVLANSFGVDDAGT
jgi:hypothetical protein